MSEIIFVKGMFVNAPRDGAPSFVKGSLAIKPAELSAWLEEQTPNEKGYIKINLKEGRDMKWYAELDTWKPDASKQKHNQAKADGYAPEQKAEFVDDDIPF